MRNHLRFFIGLVLGCVAAAAIARTGVMLARAFWPDYAAAEPHKTYTLAMLMARLIAGAVSTAAAACVTTVAAGDNGRAAWWLGALFLVVTLPHHLYQVWNDYPAWYHLVFLGYLVPVAGLAPRALRTRRKNA